MQVRGAKAWFKRKRIQNDITLIWEPFVDRLLRCNVWHVRGRDRDLVIDTGLGICSLKEEISDLLEKPVIAVATHTHIDHIGGHHEFDCCLVHRIEADGLRNREPMSLITADMNPKELQSIVEAGYNPGEQLLTAYPHPDFDPRRFILHAATPSWLVDEGDIIDIGNRAFEVLHLPGHSPGSIGLWEKNTGTLFSGDAIYDGPLLDELQGSDIDHYIQTMKRLRELPVTIVHAGHDPSFSRKRLGEIVDTYLRKRDSAYIT